MRNEMKKVSISPPNMTDMTARHGQGHQEPPPNISKMILTCLTLCVQGSREGDRIRKIVADGGLVPYELTVQVLINALIANPSQVSNQEF